MSPLEKQIQYEINNLNMINRLFDGLTKPVEDSSEDKKDEGFFDAETFGENKKK